MSDPHNSFDLSEGLDGLQADMAAHQQRFSGDVTATANQALAVQTIERLEREQAEAKPVAVPETVAPAPVERSREMRDGQHGRYMVDRGPDSPLDIRKASKAEHEFLTHALPRVELLLTKLETGPLGQASWHQRTLSVLKFKQDSIAHLQAGQPGIADQFDRRYVLELMNLLEASSIPFGDWKKDAPTKLTVSG